MRQSHLLFSALHFFLLSLLCLSGVFVILLYFSPVLRNELAFWLTQEMGHKLLLFGMGLLLLGILLVFLSINLYRTQYYQIQMGFPGHTAQVDLDVVRSLVGRYWQNHFPTMKPHIDVLLRDDSTLELFAELPLLPDEEQRVLLQRVEADLSRQLARHLNYRKPFHLTISLP